MQSTNPWSATSWNLTKQGEIVKRYGVATAQRMAKIAGAQLGDLRPMSPNERPKVYVIQGKKGLKGDPGEPGAIIPLVIDGD
jgi:hypothetical protein